MNQLVVKQIVKENITTYERIQTLIEVEKPQHNLGEDSCIIYEYLLDIVKKKHPKEVLQEFKTLFIYAGGTHYSKALKALYGIVFESNELEFINTLKRSCYILINNWYAIRQYKAIYDLIKIFTEYKISENPSSPTLEKIQTWIVNFINSKDYQELSLFISKCNIKEHWKNRFTSYLLVPQYVDQNNPQEQREAAKVVSQQLKEQFKFELAMYTARSQSAVAKNCQVKNPTGLGDEVLPLVKSIVLKRGVFSYTNLAHIFVKQTENLAYKDFKKNLLKYLLFDLEDPNFSYVLSKNLVVELGNIYSNYDEEILDKSLMFRTCNKLIEYLIAKNKKEPSELFILLLTQGQAMNLVVVLLKMVLICKQVRAHLEACLATVIRYYEKYSEAECQWVIHFLEVLNVTFAIYTENVEYNLVQMPNAAKNNSSMELDGYRIFSQFKEDRKADYPQEWA